MRDEKLSRDAAHQSTKQDSRVATRGYTAQKTMPEHRQIEAVKKFGRFSNSGNFGVLKGKPALGSDTVVTALLAGRCRWPGKPAIERPLPLRCCKCTQCLPCPQCRGDVASQTRRLLLDRARGKREAAPPIAGQASLRSIIIVS